MKIAFQLSVREEGLISPTIEYQRISYVPFSVCNMRTMQAKGDEKQSLFNLDRKGATRSEAMTAKGNNDTSVQS